LYIRRRVTKKERIENEYDVGRVSEYVDILAMMRQRVIVQDTHKSVIDARSPS